MTDHREKYLDQAHMWAERSRERALAGDRKAALFAWEKTLTLMSEAGVDILAHMRNDRHAKVH